MNWPDLLPRGLRHHFWWRDSWRKIARNLDAFPLNPHSLRHDLPSELIVSLTSYPARFSTLDKTLRSLLDQTIRPDRTLLWLGRGNIAKLPSSVLSLKAHGLTILECEDIRSHTKLVPTLEQFPEAFIITADDDVYYWPDWLAGLVEAFDPHHPSLCAYNIKRITLNAAGTPLPYQLWPTITDLHSTLPARDLFPLGNCGILYPPTALGARAVDRDMLLHLAPHCDDSWFFFNWHAAGWKVRRVPREFPMLTWPDVGGNAMTRFIATGDKDRDIAALTEYFGLSLC